MIKTIYSNDIFKNGAPNLDAPIYKDVLNRVLNGDAAFDDNLGWTDIDGRCNADWLKKLNGLAEEVRQNADVMVLIGVGGSNNAARSVIKALNPDGTKIIYAGNNLSGYEYERVIKRLHGKSVYVDVIAKNFETLEPGLSFRFLYSYLKERYGDGADSRVIATGTPGERLNKLADENGWRFLDFPEKIGGRYSALSEVGLFPMAVAGVNINDLVGAAKEEQRRILNAAPDNNEALKYAAARDALHKEGYPVELFVSFEPRLKWFSKWWEQLFGESEGKDKKGVYPARASYSEDLHSLGQFVQAGSPVLFETFLDFVLEADKNVYVPKAYFDDGFSYLDGKTVDGINKTAFEATFTAHAATLPCIKIEAPKIDAAAFGELFVFFEYACYYSCLLDGIDPFHQDGVEAYKNRMFAALGK